MNYIKEAFVNIFKQKYNSTVVFFSIVMSVFVCLLFVSLIHNINIISKTSKQGIRLIVFFNEEFKEIEKSKLKIERIEGVKNTSFFDSEQVVKNMFSDDNTFVFPKVLELIINKDNLEKIKLEIENIDGVEEVLSNNIWLEKLDNFLSFIKIISYGFIIVFVAISMLLIFYTSRVFTIIQKKEFSLMRLFGAREYRIIIPSFLSITILVILGFLFSSIIYNFIDLILNEVSLSVLINWYSIPFYYYFLILLFLLIFVIIASLLAFKRCRND